MGRTQDFSFPGTPYDVQKQLMSAMYNTIEDGSIGLFESPTGTGKTLSIICSALSWLEHNRVFVNAPQLQNDDEPDWVNDQAKGRDDSALREGLDRRKQAFANRIRNSQKQPESLPKRIRRAKNDDLFSDSDSDDENLMSKRQRTSNTRIIFATRTHSQLTQFVEELRKTKFGSDGTKFDCFSDELPISTILFGSRKHSCINETVRSLNSASAISERCRELTENCEQPVVAKRKRSSNHCPYKDQKAEAILRDKGMTNIHTIEELAAVGKEIGACPYFATRQALDSNEVDVIAVPYSAVLHEQTRRSLGITVDENTVVIFDEAHNIVNTMCELYSNVLTRPSLVHAVQALKLYMDRYRLRFSSSNLFKLRQLIHLAEGLLSMLCSREEKGGKGRVVHPSAILLEARVDNINLYDLAQFVDESRLSKKLRGFVDGGHMDNKPAKMTSKNTELVEKSDRIQKVAKQSLVAFENFLRSLSDCSKYARVAIYPYAVQSDFSETEDEFLPWDMVARLKYFLVDPAAVFSASMKNARALLLVGGTLSPRYAIKNALLKYMKRGDVVEFECDHVVPASNVITRICGKGPSGAPLEFTYATRQNTFVLDELAQAVQSCVQLVDGGVVIFFSSYELMRCTIARWKATGSFHKINTIKPIVLEQRGSNDAFVRFQEHVRRDKTKGALLAAVMGGKLSEGINFSDDLGRMVLVVGMPFANVNQPETKEVIAQLQSAKERSEYLESECLTMVNQSIGRAVRHKNDFASIILMDQRFSRSTAVQKLPRFVRRDLETASTFSCLEDDIRKFFVNHRYT